MKIVLEYPDLSTGKAVLKQVVLGDDVNGAPISRWQPAADVEVQSNSLFRAEKQTHEHRGNRQWRATWNTIWKHASLEEASLWRVTHAKAATTAKGVLKIYVSGTVLTGPVIISSVNPTEISGISTLMSYTALLDDLS